MSTSDGRVIAGSIVSPAAAFPKLRAAETEADAPLSILYVGKVSGTCLDRASALRRLGHRVQHLDLRSLLPESPWVERVTWKLGGQFWAPLLSKRLPKVLAGRRYDLCYVDGGELVTPHILELIRGHAPKVVNYQIDDPLGGRDGARSTAYRRSLPSYDLCIVMRKRNVEEALRQGARRVLRVYMTADEISHAPRPLSEQDRQRWQADVLFLGTWFPERGPLLLALAERDISLTLRGANWNKAPEWSKLKKFWRGGPLHGDDYAKAIQCAKVNIGLLSKGNRDEHTTRSLEIPALGGLLCAQRTSEHLGMYREGVEALFWDDADECARNCQFALQDEPRRQAIAAAGRRRAVENGFYNEEIMRQIIAQLHPSSDSRCC